MHVRAKWNPIVCQGQWQRRERTLEILTIEFQIQTLLPKKERKTVQIGAVNSLVRGQWQLQGPANSMHTDKHSVLIFWLTTQLLKAVLWTYGMQDTCWHCSSLHNILPSECVVLLRLNGRTRHRELQTNSKFARISHHFLASAEGDVVLPRDERCIFLYFDFFSLGNSGARLALFISNPRDCHVSKCVWITLCEVLPDVSSNLWIEFEEIRHERVLLIIVSWLWVHIQSRHKDTEIQNDRVTQTRRRRDARVHVTLGYSKLDKLTSVLRQPSDPINKQRDGGKRALEMFGYRTKVRK